MQAKAGCSIEDARKRIRDTAASFGVTLAENWGKPNGKHKIRALSSNTKRKEETDAAVAKLLLHNIPGVKSDKHPTEAAAEAAKPEAGKKPPLVLCMIDGVSLDVVLGRPLNHGDKKQGKKEDDDDDDAGNKAQPELPPKEHAGLKWDGPQPAAGSLRQQTILLCDPGVRETTVTRGPDAIRDAFELKATGKPVPDEDELVKRDGDAKVRGNRQLCTGNWDAVARPKHARKAEENTLEWLNDVLRGAATSVQVIQSRLRDLANVSSVATQMRAAIEERARAAPVLTFAYFHPIYRENRRKRLLAMRRHAEQLVASFLETATDPADHDKLQEDAKREDDPSPPPPPPPLAQDTSQADVFQRGHAPPTAPTAQGQAVQEKAIQKKKKQQSKKRRRGPPSAHQGQLGRVRSERRHAAARRRPPAQGARAAR